MQQFVYRWTLFRQNKMNFLVKIMRLEIERSYLQKEKDDISKKRVAEINTELDTKLKKQDSIETSGKIMT